MSQPPAPLRVPNSSWQRGAGCWATYLALRSACQVRVCVRSSFEHLRMAERAPEMAEPVQRPACVIAGGLY